MHGSLSVSGGVVFRSCGAEAKAGALRPGVCCVVLFPPPARLLCMGVFFIWLNPILCTPLSVSACLCTSQGRGDGLAAVLPVVCGTSSVRACLGSLWFLVVKKIPLASADQRKEIRTDNVLDKNRSKKTPHGFLPLPWLTLLRWRFLPVFSFYKRCKQGFRQFKFPIFSSLWVYWTWTCNFYAAYTLHHHLEHSPVVVKYSPAYWQENWTRLPRV